MKRLFFLIILLAMFSSCTTTQLVDNWKNPDINIFETSKILIVGITSNKKARKEYEKRLKNEYELRGIDAVMSIDILDDEFTFDEKSPSELAKVEDQLIEDGFDAILLTKVIGVEDRIAFNQSYEDEKNLDRNFKDEYYMYQDIYYNPEYYEQYAVYHAETSLYCICATEDRELIWKGYIDVVDPSSVKETVKDYVNLVMYALEEQQLINKKNTSEELES
ncbi:hypothetical protein [Urechidicola croceus]|uniref:Cardiolipin synthetase n=1 Tax=Urechidicola croceus TaxID=1850246 RepID=A0A1D8P7W7_9FLAO|nr:hypothetical protein [Urechidicola croceus]AOW20663.1 hypothetical protein LPB138_08235 [Urechidicola croceus]